MFCVQIDNKAVQNFPCFVCWCSASRNSGLEYYGYKLFETEKQTLEETAQLLCKLRLFTAYTVAQQIMPRIVPPARKSLEG